MPGIVGICSSSTRANEPDNRIKKMVDAVSHQPGYGIAAASSAHGEFACVHLNCFNHAIIARSEDGRIGVMLDGWIPESRNQQINASKDAAHYCLAQYLEHGIEFVKGINGQFNLVVWDERTDEVLIINDRYALRPLQYAVIDGELYFAPEGKAILAGSETKPALNLDTLVNLLSWGRIWIGDDTFFEGIKILPPASVLRWKDNQATIFRYWSYTHEPQVEIGDDYIEHTVDTFRRAVKRYTSSPARYGISLSGGLDSRAVLAAFTSQHGSEIKSYSWGVFDEHDELKLARQTAEKLGVSWQFIPLAPEDFIRHARRGVRISEGLDLLVQSQGLITFPLMSRECDISLTGLALDLTLGGTYLTDKLVEGKLTSEDAFMLAMKQSSVFSNDDCQQMLRLKDTATRLESLRQQAWRDWQNSSDTHPANQSDNFFLHHRVWRYTFTRQQWQRLFVEDVAPTFDNELMDCLLRIPPAHRAGHRFYQRFLRKLDKRMMEIPYQRTLLPPSAPLEFWSRAAQLEEQKEGLLRDVYHATNGEVFVPYTRFSTNYDEWLRRDASWIKLTDDLLLSDESLACERYINRQAVAEIVSNHRSGKAANHKKILQLMTLELLLREFFV